MSRLSSWKPPVCMNHVSTFWVPRSPPAHPAKNLRCPRWLPLLARISRGCLKPLGCQDWNTPQKPSIPPLILSTSKLLLLGEDDIVECTHSLQEFHRSSPSLVLHWPRVVTYASVSHPGPRYFYNIANQHPKHKAFVMFQLVNISQVKIAHSASWTQQRGALAPVSPSCSVCAAP